MQAVSLDVGSLSDGLCVSLLAIAARLPSFRLAVESWCRDLFKTIDGFA